MSSGGRGCSELRWQRCTLAWVTKRDSVSKKKERKKEKENVPAFSETPSSVYVSVCACVCVVCVCFVWCVVCACEGERMMRQKRESSLVTATSIPMLRSVVSSHPAHTGSGWASEAHARSALQSQVTPPLSTGNSLLHVQGRQRSRGGLLVALGECGHELPWGFLLKELPGEISSRSPHLS